MSDLLIIPALLAEAWLFWQWMKWDGRRLDARVQRIRERHHLEDQ